jgi:hypothetical protein
MKYKNNNEMTASISKISKLAEKKFRPAYDEIARIQKERDTLADQVAHDSKAMKKIHVPQLSAYDEALTVAQDTFTQLLIVHETELNKMLSDSTTTFYEANAPVTKQHHDTAVKMILDGCKMLDDEQDQLHDLSVYIANECKPLIEWLSQRYGTVGLQFPLPAELNRETTSHEASVIRKVINGENLMDAQFLIKEGTNGISRAQTPALHPLNKIAALADRSLSYEQRNKIAQNQKHTNN